MQAAALASSAPCAAAARPEHRQSPEDTTDLTGLLMANAHALASMGGSILSPELTQ